MEPTYTSRERRRDLDVGAQTALQVLTRLRGVLKRLHEDVQGRGSLNTRPLRRQHGETNQEVTAELNIFHCTPL